MATWPPAPDRSTISRSRRCSKGLSTMPTGTFSPPRSGQPAVVRPSSGSGDERRQQLVQRGRLPSAAAATPGAPAGPESRSRSIATDSSVPVLVVGLRRRRLRTSAGAGSRRGTTRRVHGTTWLATCACASAPVALPVGAGDVGGPEPGQRLDAGLAGSRCRAARAARRRRARRARPGSPSRRTCAGRSGTTGGSPAGASGPRPGAARRAAGARRGERPSRPIITNRSMNSRCAASSSLNSSTTTNRVGSGRERRRRRRGPARSPAREV